METYELDVGDLVMLRSKVKRAVIVAKYKKFWFMRYIIWTLDGTRHLCNRSDLQYLRTASELETNATKVLEDQATAEGMCS